MRLPPARSLAVIALAIVAACSGSSEPAPTPTTLSKVAGDQQSGVAGTAVAIAPSVRIQDAGGNPVANVTAVFTATAGGGSVSGGSAVSNSDGLATIGSWTLGAQLGVNTLSVSVAGITAPVTFTATGTAGPAASVLKVAGDNQSGTTSTPVPVPPSVRVLDSRGNAVRNVTVTFAVATGGGTVTAGQQTTSDAGIATVTAWTLGPNAGQNTVTATVAGLTPVTFTATASQGSNPACTSGYPTLAFDTPITGALAVADCRLSTGHYLDFYNLTVGTVPALLLTETSTAFDTNLLLLTSTPRTVGSNDDESQTIRNSRLKALVSPGSFLVAATSYYPDSVGPYTLTATTTTAAVTACEDVTLMRGLTTSQDVSSADCVDQSGPYFGDAYYVHLDAGFPVTIDMTATGLDAYLELYIESSGQFVTSNNNRAMGVTDARITVTPGASTTYVVFATTNNPGESGAYTLNVTQTFPAAVRAAGARSTELMSILERVRGDGPRAGTSRMQQILSNPARVPTRRR